MAATMPAGPSVNLILGYRDPLNRIWTNRPAKATNDREPSPAMKPKHGVVICGGLARTTWALIAIWLGDGRPGRCRARIQRRLRLARSRTFHLFCWGECR